MEGDNMVSVTMSVPEDLKKKMDGFPEINWSEVARGAIREKVKKLEFVKYFASESDLTEEDAKRLGREVSKAVAKKLKGLK